MLLLLWLLVADETRLLSVRFFAVCLLRAMIRARRLSADECAFLLAVIPTTTVTAGHPIITDGQPNEPCSTLIGLPNRR